MHVCLVLGAGATLANALHFRPTIRRDARPPLDVNFFETVDARRISLTDALNRYFVDIVGIDPTPTTLRERRMEEVFKDVYFDFLDNPNDRTILDAYIDLVNLYLEVLRGTTNWLGVDKRRGGPVGRLIADAAENADDVTIMTFNHDLVIENEIHRRARLRARWCLDQGYGSVSTKLGLTSSDTSGGVPLFAYHSDDCDHTRPIRILKLHGSLNWVTRMNSQRPTANFLKGQATTRPMFLLQYRRVLTDVTVGSARKDASSRGRSRWLSWPVVVPPVYAKQSLRAGIELVWGDARDALLTADRVVTFGYSLPEIDVEAEKLFERSLFHNEKLPWVDIVNPAPASAGRFAGVAGSVPIRWYPTLESFLEAGGLGL
jgi:hypothetical protein